MRGRVRESERVCGRERVIEKGRERVIEGKNER